MRASRDDRQIDRKSRVAFGSDGPSMAKFSHSAAFEVQQALSYCKTAKFQAPHLVPSRNKAIVSGGPRVAASSTANNCRQSVLVRQAASNLACRAPRSWVKQRMSPGLGGLSQLIVVPVELVEAVLGIISLLSSEAVRSTVAFKVVRVYPALFRQRNYHSEPT
jgi:hypothetical protein